MNTELHRTFDRWLRRRGKRPFKAEDFRNYVAAKSDEPEEGWQHAIRSLKWQWVAA